MSFTGPTEYDFRGIGINLTLANGEQEKYNTFIENFHKDPRTAYMYDVDSRNLKIKDNMIVTDSFITINNVRYTVGSNISRGTFGILSVVTIGVTSYALKIQHITDLSGFTNTAVNALNEVLCQHIVSQHTYNGTPLAPKIIVTGVDSKYQYTVMERLPTSLGRYLSPPDIDRSLDFLTHLADCLSYLQKTLKFTHGDLKYNNIMFDTAGKMRLIDFGQTRIEVPVVIECSTYTTKFNPCRDLIQFSAFQLGAYKNSPLDPLLKQIILCGSNYVYPSEYRDPTNTELHKYTLALDTLDCSGCVGTPEGVKRLISKGVPSCFGCLWGGKRTRRKPKRSRKNNRRTK
jgi:serine/threonine protein kinase